MKVPVAWYRTQSSWDGALPRYILHHATEGEYSEFLVTPSSIRHFSAFANPHELCVFVIPGQHSLNDYFMINEAAGDFDRVVFIINGDEEALFDVSQLKHRHMKVWWFAPPFPAKHRVNRVAIFGWPVGAPEMIEKERSEIRDIPWSFAGQVTHDKRQECYLASWELTRDGKFLATSGFSKGLPRENYYRMLAHSKFVLCPAGPHTPDTFRFAEALEAGCVPIVEKHGYWNYVFDDPLPFPVIKNWGELPDLFGDLLASYETMKYICDYWWIMQKQKYISWMRADL